MKVILDTDIGDDIDDAYALALGLHLPEVEFVGITTVYKNTEFRARMVKKFLLQMGRDIPVYAGHSQPLNGTVNAAERFCQMTDDLTDPRYSPDGFQEDAVDFLLESARKYKEQLTIIAIGPLTNIARAYQKDPSALERIGKLIFMGGCFFEQFREYNVECDPEAAQMIFSTPMPVHCVSADVTWQVPLSPEETARLCALEGDDLFGAIGDATRRWRERCYWAYPLLHDPLALYYAVHPEILGMKEVLVYVETEGKVGRGFTFDMDRIYKYLEHPPEGKRILCSSTVRAGEFKRVFFDTLFGNVQS